MKNLGTLLFCHGLSFMGTGRPLRPRSAENPFGTAPGASAEGSSLLQLEPSKAAKKQCKGVTKNGAACTAWAMEGGLCYFHANPDKAAELGRSGGRRRRTTYEESSEHIAVPESAADARRMLAETMAEVKAGRMEPKAANTVAYLELFCCGRMKRIRLSVRIRQPSHNIRAAHLSVTDSPGPQET